MFTIHNILHPTDFSPVSQAAFHVACSLALAQQARLVLLHVLEPSATVYLGGVLIPGPGEEVALARKKLEDLAAQAPGILTTLVLTAGDTARDILRTAGEQHCDLIVMGTHGRSGLLRVLLGSVAEEVLRHSPYPVLTVKASVPLAESSVHEETVPSTVRG
jgi:nucleotide-binding universal stress UspA family protein